MVSVADVESAQKAWGEGIVAIANAHANQEDYVGIASNHINTLYGYQMGPVLFKPTLAAIDQFRPTFDTALSYFVASHPLLGVCASVLIFHFCLNSLTPTDAILPRPNLTIST